ncbi:MAG: hypothetical protein K9K64_09180 [Desulfohalobiaceae bacterium]|nr:hypothetical protein [Desulfohalobiaceae bacterium]
MEEGRVFQNRLQAQKHLLNCGYKIKKSKIYSDVEKGLLRIRSDGSVSESDLVEYVHLADLKRPEEDGPDHGMVVQGHEEKRILEREKLRLEVEKQKFQLQKDRGHYLPRAAFDSGLRTKINAHARDLVYLVGGKPEKIPEFLQRVFELLDEQITEVTLEKPEEKIF